MTKIDKPKCRGCGKTGEEAVFVFQKASRGKKGYWWHFSCWTSLSRETTGKDYRVVLLHPKLLRALHKRNIDYEITPISNIEEYLK